MPNFLTQTFTIGGRYSMTVSAGRPTGRNVHAWTHWAPRAPEDLTDDELGEVQRATRAFADRLAARHDKRDHLLHVSIPSSLQKSKQSATPPLGAQP